MTTKKRGACGHEDSAAGSSTSFISMKENPWQPGAARDLGNSRGKALFDAPEQAVFIRLANTKA